MKGAAKRRLDSSGIPAVRAAAALCCALLLASCAALREAPPGPGASGLERHRIAAARIALDELGEVDAVVTLDNARLGAHLADALEAQAALSGALVLDGTQVRFEHQRIAIETTVSRRDTPPLVAHGDIEIVFSGEALEWFPSFRRVTVAGGARMPWSPAPEPDEDTRDAVLASLNASVARALVDRDGNTIPLDVVPRAEITVGASLTGRGRSAEGSATLADGVFVLQGAVVLVEPGATRLALDLAFQPSLAACPPGVTVSRALFATEVRDREPLAAPGMPGRGGDAQFFYSEIAGASEPLTVVHYWFADGRAVAVTELTVEPSARWRTWSSRGEAGEGAGRYQVLVVDKGTGCILHSQAVRVAEDIIDIPGPGDTRAALREAWLARTAGFASVVPPVAEVEVRRAFLAEVFGAGAGDVTVEVAFDDAPLPEQRVAAPLFNPGSTALTCVVDECETLEPVACTLSLDACERLRDTRDCSSCLFRNPLNNRCVSQAVDPICEAARTRQNARYDSEWRACVDRAERSLAACEARRAEAGGHCAAAAPGAAARCERLRATLDALPGDSAVGLAEARIVERGPLTAIFSGFEIDGDFERLRMDLALRSRMTVSGELNLTTPREGEVLGECLAAWSGPFAGRLDSPGPATRMVAALGAGEGGFVARWSGWALPFRIDPAPLEVRGTSQARPVQACGGIDTGELARALVGEGAAFLGGERRIELVPTPTRLELGPAEIRFGERTHRAPPTLGPETVRWTIGG